MMNVQFVGQVPKDASHADENEDAIAIDAKSGIVAISDGASESFESKTWAHLLANSFAKRPGLDSDWLTGVISEYAKCHDVASMSWSKVAAYEKGSFATLLGIEECVEHGTADVLAVGDSMAVLLDGTDFIRSFRYRSSGDFQRRPELFSTKASHNSFFQSPDLRLKHLATWSLSGINSPIVLCMTDALAEWALRMSEQGNPKWETLSGIQKANELESLVLLERRAKKMRTDDSTLVRLSF